MSQHRNSKGGATCPSDSELIQRIRSRDQNALTLTMEKYSPPVFAAALRVLRRHPEAQEVTQDVFWALWRSPERFNMARGRLETWLLILSRSRALDLLRRIQSESAWVGELGNETATLRPDVERDILLQEILHCLPEKQAIVLQRVYREGYALREVAVLERVPLGTIKNRARFALKKLRSELRASELPARDRNLRVDN